MATQNEALVTYRAYVLNVTNVDAPTVDRVFVRGINYAEAWKHGRAALNVEKTGKQNVLYVDADCKTFYEKCGDAFTFVRCDNMKARNAKVDAKALREILANPKATDAEKLAALAGMMK